MARKKSGSCKKPKKKYLFKLEGFEDLSSHIQDFESVLEVSIHSENLKYQLGNFFLTLQNCPKNCEIIYVCFKELSSECFVCWKEEYNVNNQAQDDTDSELKNKPKVAFSYGEYLLPFELLVSLCNKKHFTLVFDSSPFDAVKLNLKVFINPSSICNLLYPAQRYRINAQAQVCKVVEHFCGISIEDYEKEYVEDEKFIEKIYKCIKNSYKSDIDEEIFHPLLIPQLRPYQSQAVKWMLDCETRSKKKDIEDVDQLHVLYEELNLCNGSKIFFQKYSGMFVEKKFVPLPLCKGGILADEMGLGKTVEVFALILLHPRNVLKESSQLDMHSNEDISNDSLIFKDENKFRRSAQNTSDNLLGQKRSSDACEDSFPEDKERSPFSVSFECICGSENSDYEVVICDKCGLAQHSECILSDPCDICDPYVCPYCLVDSSSELIKSGSTLIVSPFSILHQWEHEVKKHIVPGKLQVFLYLGVEKHKFVNPKTLADYDIVLTSYEVLKRESSHVDVPHGENQRSFRTPKKFRAIPSPLPAIEWWRVCLDEAQMVESVSSKVAQVALHLNCVNRWCVTGTPIQKSVEDLFGLLLFLGYDPYQEKKWWTKLLYEPFANGVTDNLTSVLNNILWRTDKILVIDQMNIPKQETKLYKLELSRVERVFYGKILNECRSDFLEKVKKYDCEYAKLKAIDKHVLSKILLPLKKVEQACCHFQLAGSNFSNIDRCKMTIPELLEHLLKNAMLECAEMHRKKVLDLNGLAGTQCLKGLFKEACDTYSKAILSAEENKKFVKTDSFQLIHTLHNYLKTIQAWQESGEDLESIKKFLDCEDISKFCQDMSEKCSDLCEKYFIKFEENSENCKSNLLEISNEIKDLCGKASLISQNNDKWWIKFINSLGSSEQQLFINKIKEHLENVYGASHFQDSWSSLFSSFTNASGLVYCLATASEALNEARGYLEKSVLEILRRPTQSDVESAAECHLRPIPKQQAPKCIYCKTDDAFKRYESKLFHFKETPDSDDEPCNEDSEDDEEICFKPTRKGNKQDNEFETCMKFLGNYCNRTRGSLKFVDDAKNDLKLFEVYKKEFKALRNAWLNASEYVAALDELEMAKTSLRLSLPGEKIKDSSVHIIAPHELERSMWQFESSASYHHHEFKKKLGQLFYLQNLKKAENVNEPFEESCPICCTSFDGYWTVLQCGHTFCLECIQTICQKPGIRCSKIRCPVCREETETSDIYYLEPPGGDNSVQGSYSTKVSALIQCLLSIQKNNPEDKSLVFSTWKNLLSILENALKENDINYVTLSDKRGAKFQEALNVFKNNKDCTVLLLPLKIGANGLNIVEASHVLIAEPLLNNSQILQAIGRVHRIGQTKETTVHEFVVKNTIEENIHLVHNKDSPSEDNIDDILTVQHLKHLFDSC